MKIKIIKTLILIITILLLFSTSQVFALGIDPSYYEPDLSNSNSTTLKAKVGGILGIINVVGVVCSVVIICIIGIKYMLGSVEEKAEYKKTMLAYLIGAMLLFSATTIPNILFNVGQSIGDDTTSESGTESESESESETEGGSINKKPSLDKPLLQQVYK